MWVPDDKPASYIGLMSLACSLMMMWAVSCKKVPEIMRRCHIKKGRLGIQYTHPSFGTTPTLKEKEFKKKKKKERKRKKEKIDSKKIKIVKIKLKIKNKKKSAFNIPKEGRCAHSSFSMTMTQAFRTFLLDTSHIGLISQACRSHDARLWCCIKNTLLVRQPLRHLGTF